jgi:hypothetical protein
MPERTGCDLHRSRGAGRCAVLRMMRWFRGDETATTSTGPLNEPVSELAGRLTASPAQLLLRAMLGAAVWRNDVTVELTPRGGIKIRRALHIEGLASPNTSASHVAVPVGLLPKERSGSFPVIEVRSGDGTQLPVLIRQRSKDAALEMLIQDRLRPQGMRPDEWEELASSVVNLPPDKAGEAIDGWVRRLENLHGASGLGVALEWLLWTLATSDLLLTEIATGADNGLVTVEHSRAEVSSAAVPIWARALRFLGWVPSRYLIRDVTGPFGSDVGVQVRPPDLVLVDAGVRSEGFGRRDNREAYYTAAPKGSGLGRVKRMVPRRVDVTMVVSAVRDSLIGGVILATLMVSALLWLGVSFPGELSRLRSTDQVVPTLLLFIPTVLAGWLTVASPPTHPISRAVTRFVRASALAVLAISLMSVLVIVSSLEIGVVTAAWRVLAITASAMAVALLISAARIGR